MELSKRVEDLENLLKCYEEHLERLKKEMENCNLKIGLVCDWIFTRFGKSFSSLSFQKTKKSKHSNSYLQRSLQIKASIRKRRHSSLTQKIKVSQNLEVSKDNAKVSLGVIQHTNDLCIKSQTDKIPLNAQPNKEESKNKVDEQNLNRPKPKNNTPMVCDECGKVLKGKSSLRSHKLSHSNERPYHCHHPQCLKSFRMKHHLDFHLLTHDDGGKKWTCKFCSKGFIAQRDLLRHERTHTGERPFNCSFKDCKKSFNVKQHLTLHLRTHTGERPYQCLICFKTFTQANSLRIHKKIHTKSKVP